MAIAWAVIEYLHDKVKCRCLTATHYHQMSQMVKDNLSCSSAYQILATNKSMIDDSSVHLLHKVVPGHCQDSFGIETAEIAGIPSEIILRARHLKQARSENSNELDESGCASEAVIPNQKKNSIHQYKLDTTSIGRAIIDVGNDLSKLEVDQLDFLSLINKMSPEKASQFLQDMKNLLSNIQ